MDFDRKRSGGNKSRSTSCVPSHKHEGRLVPFRQLESSRIVSNRVESTIDLQQKDARCVQASLHGPQQVGEAVWPC